MEPLLHGRWSLSGGRIWPISLVHQVPWQWLCIMLFSLAIPWSYMLDLVGIDRKVVHFDAGGRCDKM